MPRFELGDAAMFLPRHGEVERTGTQGFGLSLALPHLVPVPKVHNLQARISVNRQPGQTAMAEFMK